MPARGRTVFLRVRAHTILRKRTRNIIGEHVNCWLRCVVAADSDHYATRKNERTHEFGNVHLRAAVAFEASALVQRTEFFIIGRRAVPISYECVSLWYSAQRVRVQNLCPFMPVDGCCAFIIFYICRRSRSSLADGSCARNSSAIPAAQMALPLCAILLLREINIVPYILHSRIAAAMQRCINIRRFHLRFLHSLFHALYSRSGAVVAHMKKTLDYPPQPASHITNGRDYENVILFL